MSRLGDESFAVSAFDPTLERGITAFLADLDVLVERHLPPAELKRLTDDAEKKLEAAIRSHQTPGRTSEQVLALALRDVGDPAELADAALDHWFRSGKDTWLSRRVGKANVIAFAVFGIAQLAAILNLHLTIVSPEMAWIAQMSPEDTASDALAGLFPQPAPYLWSGTMPLFALGLPILAGALTGWLIPIKPHRYVYHVLLPLILYSFFSGVAILPATDGLVFAILQVVYWLPAGCLAAILSANLTRRWRRRIRGELLLETETQ